MSSRGFLVVCLFPGLFLTHGIALGQSFSSQGLYCTVGLIPDGNLDLTQFPAPPTVTPGLLSAPVTATLPVHSFRATNSDRVLSENEAAAVENYLAQKYGLH